MFTLAAAMTCIERHLSRRKCRTRIQQEKHKGSGHAGIVHDMEGCAVCCSPCWRGLHILHIHLQEGNTHNNPVIRTEHAQTIAARHSGHCALGHLDITCCCCCCNRSARPLHSELGPCCLRPAEYISLYLTCLSATVNTAGTCGLCTFSAACARACAYAKPFAAVPAAGGPLLGIATPFAFHMPFAMLVMQLRFFCQATQPNPDANPSVAGWQVMHL
jgi:hypothetical protein